MPLDGSTTHRGDAGHALDEYKLGSSRDVEEGYTSVCDWKMSQF